MIKDEGKLTSERMTTQSEKNKQNSADTLVPILSLLEAFQASKLPNFYS